MDYNEFITKKLEERNKMFENVSDEVLADYYIAIKSIYENVEREIAERVLKQSFLKKIKGGEKEC